MRHKLSADIFKTVVASEAFEHLKAKETSDGSVDRGLEGREKPVSSKAVNPHAKFAGFYEDYLQKALSEIHKNWQQMGDKSMQEMLKQLPSDTHKMLFALAKLHYQVQNGGFGQWVGNGYAGNGQGDMLLNELPKEGTLGEVNKVLVLVNAAFENYAEESGQEYHSFDDAEDVMNNTDISGTSNAWSRFCDDNSHDVGKIEERFPGFDLESHQMSLDIDMDEIPVEVVKNLPQDLEETSDCEAWQNFIDANDDAQVMQWLDMTESEYSDFQLGLSELYEFLHAFDKYEEYGQAGDFEENLDNYDSAYYNATQNEEEYFQEVSNFLETMEPNIASLKKAFKLGSYVVPSGSRPFRVLAAARTTDDLRIQARYLDGSIETLNKTHLASLTNLLGSTLRRFSNLMITSYNKDFDLYVKTAIREAGLPVDEDMNWSSYLESIYKKVIADQDLRDEAAHHMIITHLYQLKTLLKFDPNRAPDKDNPLEKQVTTFLKKMFSYSVSKARDWVGEHYGYGKVYKTVEIDPETGEEKKKVEIKNQEVQPEFGTGDETYNIFDTKPTLDDHTELESSSDLKEFKAEFFPWLTRTMGKKVGPNLAILFDATLTNEVSDEIWKDFEAKTQKSFSYYKKAIVNLRECITKFIKEGNIDKSNLLVKLVNDYTKKLVKMEDEEKSVKKQDSAVTSSQEKPMGRLSQIIAKKKEAAAKAEALSEAKTAASKFATLKRIAEEEPEALGEAIAELRDKFMEQVEALDALAENLNLTPDDLVPEEGESLEEEALEGEAKEGKLAKKRIAKKRIAKKRIAKKFAVGLRRVADEEPEEVSLSLNEIYSNLDHLAEGVENLADNLGVELEDSEEGSESEFVSDVELAPELVAE
jgi:hypothetical protein